MSNKLWPESRLKDSCEYITVGHVGPMAEYYVDEGIPFLRSQNIQAFRLNTADIKFITQAFHQKLKKSALRPGDVAVVRTGYPGTACVIPKSLPTSNCSDLVIIRPSASLDPFYVAALFNSSWGRQTVAGNLVGVAQQHFNVGAAKEMLVHLPPLHTQRKIAAILSAYDDLIENNTRRIAILEEMAQSIYREWFVNFRFPGHENIKLVDSPLGQIPDGWTVGVVNDLLTLQSGFAFKSETFVSAGEYKLVTIKNVHDGEFDISALSLLEVIPDRMPSHCQLKTGDILMSLTGNIGRTCLVFGENFLLNQRVAKIHPHRKEDQPLVYSMFRNPEARRRLEQIANGVAQQNLSPIQTGKLEIPIPPVSLRDSYGDVVSSMVKAILNLNRRNAVLRTTRDLLLPKLISGQLNVEDLDIDLGATAKELQETTG